MDGLLLVAVQGHVFCYVDVRRINTRSFLTGELLAVLGSVCGVVVNQPHQVALCPNAVVSDGVKNICSGVINLCDVQISRALVGRFEGFERRFGFFDGVGRRRQWWSVLNFATGSRRASFVLVLNQHYLRALYVGSIIAD